MSMPLLSTIPTSAKQFSKVVGNGRSAAQSRSTSAGSSSAQSNGQDRIESPTPILSTSVKSSPAGGSLYSVRPFQPPATLPVDNSLYSNNTLFSTSVKQSPSLEEYFQEQQTKACPASMISPPPGLEDYAQPEDAAARRAEAEAAGLNWEVEAMANNAAEMEPVFNVTVNDVARDFEIPQFLEAEIASQHLRNHFQAAGDEVLQAMQQLPKESFSLLLNEADTQQSWAEFFDIPHGFESQELFMSSMQQSPAWDSCIEATLPMDSLMAVEPVDAEYCMAGFELSTEEQLDMGEYCTAGLELSAEEQLDMQFAGEDFAPSWHLQSSHGPQEAELGSFECPTIGSQAHFFGTCRPCAFHYTKGCSNGVLCSFCHLCDEGERKRRAKDKRVAKKVAMWSGPTIF